MHDIEALLERTKKLNGHDIERLALAFDQNRPWEAAWVLAKASGRDPQGIRDRTYGAWIEAVAAAFPDLPAGALFLSGGPPVDANWITAFHAAGDAALAISIGDLDSSLAASLRGPWSAVIG